MYVQDNSSWKAIDGTSDGSQRTQWSIAMNPLQWQFLNEPAWKWAVFIVAMGFFLAAWNGAVRYMK